LRRQFPPRQMRKEWIHQVGSVDMEKVPAIRIRLRLQVLHVRVKTFQQEWAPAGIQLRRPEPADFRLLENIVAAKELIGALARQDDLVTQLAHQSRQQKQRSGRRAQYRFLGVSDNLRKDGANVVVGAPQRVVLGRIQSDNLLLESALVKLAIVERYRKGAQASRRPGLGQRGRDRRIEASTQVASDRDIGSQPNACGLAQQLQHPGGSFLLADLDRREVEAPIRPDVDPPILHAHAVARRKFLHALEHLRADETTIQKHLDLLAGHPRLQAFYRSFSKSIMDMYNI